MNDVSQTHDVQGNTKTSDTYSGAARQFHWITAAFVFALIPIGLYMTYRGEVTKFDALTNILYDNHKLGGFILLFIVVARLAYRFMKGAPADEPTLEPWQRGVAHLTHWGLYGLLLAVPLLGWIGVSLYPALSIHGWFSLPGLTTPDQSRAATVFFLHKWGAILLGLMVSAHIGAALFHHFIRKDNVLRRMMPKIKVR
ncbi:MAG: cytochrome b [Beijerinckiaceae bacterium]